jgi:hypothetical protein
MTTEAPTLNHAHHHRFDAPEHGRQTPERSQDHEATHLERGQLVAETSRPVPRAALSARAVAGLWALRIFVVLVSLMVIYTFIHQLR